MIEWINKHIIKLLFISFISFIIYRFYELYQITYFDEKCFNYQKIITDKIDLKIHNNDYFYRNEKYIQKLFKKNHKCFFTK